MISATSASHWKLVPLGSIAKFRNGINYNKNNFGTGIKVVNVKDFQDRTLIPVEDLDEINPDGVVSKESLLKNGDIIFVRSNGNRQLIGRSLFVNRIKEKITHSAFTIRVRFTSDLTIPQFYSYLFRSSFMRQIFSSQGGGTNINNLNQKILEDLQVPIPPITTQRKIAAILSAYDDLIENNTRRIKILEEIAQALYREWFVYFRFPGHENVPMVDSPLGEIPEGWVGRLDDALILQRGFDLPIQQRREGNIPVYAATGITGMHDEAKVKGPGIVTGRSGSLGTVIYIEEDFWPLNTTLWVKEFRKVTPIYAFYLLKSLELITFNSGAAVPTLNRNDVHGCPVIIPSHDILEKFDSHTSPLFAMKGNLDDRNTNLCRTRDLLLPKLITGEICINEIMNGGSTKRCLP